MPSPISNDVWLTTEQAAQLLWYSVPYTAAWLATKEFALAVKTVNGQAVVLESFLRDWMIRNDVQKPLPKEAMAKVRKEFLAGGWEPLDDPLPITEAPDYEAVLARKVESISNRPMPSTSKKPV